MFTIQVWKTCSKCRESKLATRDSFAPDNRSLFFCASACRSCRRVKVRQKKGVPSRLLWLRFWEKVKTGDGCWTWTGSLSGHGYGTICLDGRGTQTGAHRASWLLHHGEIPRGLYVLHKCDNRACVRPDHLYLGTHQQNMTDMARKNRGGNSKLCLEEASQILRLYKPYKCTAPMLARRIGVTDHTIRAILGGKRRFAL
jgi:hypothetical protein